MPNKYEIIDPQSHADLVEKVKRGDPKELSTAIVAIALHHPDRLWAQKMCVELSAHSDSTVRGNAVLGFGHLARRFGVLDVEQVKPIIEAALRVADSYVRGQAWAAADDTELFLKWHIARHDEDAGNYPHETER